jgi:catechol 2,3-dioxygenase-like lactoylglutathione lyase family enzyme
MSSLLKDGSIGAITIFTEDLARSRAFYRDVFGKSVIFEDANSAVFKFGETVINVLAVPAAGELVAPGTVAPGGAGVRAVMTVEVDDVDAVCAELAQRRVQLLNGPMNRPWGLRTASFIDPGGHVWEIAQAAPSAGSQTGS